MTRNRCISVVAVAVLLGGAGVLIRSPRAVAGGQDADARPSAGKPVRTLLLTGGEIHDHKGVGDVTEAYLRDSGHFDVTRVQGDLNALAAERLAPYDLVVFYWTLGEITEAQKRGLMNFVASGKGFVTFHSGADSFRGDPDYRAFVGGYFVHHPHYRHYQVSVTETNSPITKGIDEFFITDEQYLVDYDPRVDVLAYALWKGKSYPVLWTKPWGKGRIFYNALGHDAKACKQEMFGKLLVRGALWAAGRDVPQ